jgi:hypothetical protein
LDAGAAPLAASAAEYLCGDRRPLPGSTVLLWSSTALVMASGTRAPAAIDADVDLVADDDERRERKRRPP